MRALRVFLVLLTAGCAAQIDDGLGDNGGTTAKTGSAGGGADQIPGEIDNSGNGGSGGRTGGTGATSPAQKLVGTWNLTTQYNLLDALPSDVKTPLALALELADSPGAFLFDMAGRIDGLKYIVDLVSLFKPFKDSLIHGIDEYLQGNNGFALQLHEIAENIEKAIRGLKAKNQWVIASPDPQGNVKVTDTLTALTFTYAGQEYDYPQGAKATTTGTATATQLTVAEHQYDRTVKVGSMVVDLLDNVALPQLTGAGSLGDLLNQLIDCGGFGDWAYSYVANLCIPNPLDDFNDVCVSDKIQPDDLSRLCELTLNLAGKIIEAEIKSQIDAQLDAVASQTAATCTVGKSGTAVTLQNGAWTMKLPTGKSAIMLPGTFTATNAAAKR